MTFYTLDEKKKVLDDYFEEDNIIKQSISHMERHNSLVDDYVLKNRKLIYEVLKMRGDDVIRFAIARDGCCTCDSFLADKDDMINLRDLLNKVYPVEKN